MTEPTITQNCALYLAQHKPRKRSKAERRRLLTAGVNRLCNRTHIFDDVMNVGRLNLSQQ